MDENEILSLYDKNEMICFENELSKVLNILILFELHRWKIFKMLLIEMEWLMYEMKNQFYEKMVMKFKPKNLIQKKSLGEG